jgi:hypothetical protein
MARTTRIIRSCFVFKRAWALLPSYHLPTTVLLPPCVIHLSLLYGPHGLTPLLIIHIPSAKRLLPSTSASPLKGIHHTYSSTSFAYRIFPCVPFAIPLSPCRRGPITSFPCPTFRTVLPAYPLSQSVIPGGCMGGPPRPESAELAGPSSIPMSQLLKWLVVVRHRLCLNGKARP